MKHRHRHSGGRDGMFFSPEGFSGGGGRHGGRHGGREGGRGFRRRLFDYGEMRLLVLGLISENPSYGYELIRTIEQRFGGSYTPSPGVIYPTLSWLEEAGHIRPVEEEGRKNYHITPEGAAFLAANDGAMQELRTRMATGAAEEGGDRRNIPMPVMRAMENLRTALRLRLRNGGMDAEASARIAAILDQAALAVEESAQQD